MTDSPQHDVDDAEVEVADDSAAGSEVGDPELLDESLVEEVSIDGMCGVY